MEFEKKRHVFYILSGQFLYNNLEISDFDVGTTACLKLFKVVIQKLAI